MNFGGYFRGVLKVWHKSRGVYDRGVRGSVVVVVVVVLVLAIKEVSPGICLFTRGG